MAISLQKGGHLNLSQEVPNLSSVIIGLGWDPRALDGTEFDLDGSVFLLTADGRVRSDSDFIFYNNLQSEDGSVVHTGDSLTGQGDGDDEQIEVDLGHVAAEIVKIVFCATIHDAQGRHQSFGMVGKAYIRCVNAGGGAEIARFDLSDEASADSAMIFGELVRDGSQWQFHAVGQGFSSSLGQLARSFGVNV